MICLPEIKTAELIIYRYFAKCHHVTLSFLAEGQCDYWKEWAKVWAIKDCPTSRNRFSTVMDHYCSRALLGAAIYRDIFTVRRGSILVQPTCC